MISHDRRLFVAALFAAVATPAIAGSGKNSFDSYVYIPNFNPADKARIAKATAYLQALSTAKGRFEQTDYRGKVTLGNWFLARPGKIRFEYDPPFSLLIVSDGKNVNMWDPRLQSFNQYPLDQTPLSLFLSKQIRFDEGVVVTEVTSNSAGFNLTARDRRKQVEGSVVLGFNQIGDGPVTLREWTVTDAQNRPTTIKLTSLAADSALSPDLFVLRNPQPKK